MIPKKPVPDVIRDGNRFPAFAKPASAGEARSGKIVLKRKRSNRSPTSRVIGQLAVISVFSTPFHLAGVESILFP